MDISKTQFKNYCKCKSYYALDTLYYDHKINDEEKENMLYFLNKMFNEAGDDMVKIPNEQLEAMLTYYQETERLALEEASKTFKKKFEYKEKTTEQKYFSITDDFGNTLYTYLDGYNEDNKITIIEVKATTSKKFLKLGYTKNNVLYPLFEKNDNILSLKKNLSEKDIRPLNRLYDINSDCGKYMFDFGITKYIVTQSLKKAGINKEVNYYLGILNSDYIKDINNKETEKLICFVDCTEILKDYIPIIHNLYLEILEYTKTKEYNIVQKSEYLNICNNCEYFDICHENLTQKNSILKFIGKKGVGKLKIKDLIDLGYYNLKDIPLNLIDDKNNVIQRNAIDNHKEYIDKERIKKEIDNLEYPIYHLDFEGFNSPIPRFFGETPYTQSLFQFSIHIEKEPGICDIDKDNYFFLPHDFEDHREELIKEMIKTIDLTNGGTVLVYNKTYESTQIKKLAQIFPKYSKELLLINSKIVDLLEIIKGKKSEGINYYHEDLEQSFSIKKVLPVFSDLSYKNLDVKNGNEAIVEYSKFKYLPKEDIEESRKKLLKYCGLDTYSMHIILKELRRKVR